MFWKKIIKYTYILKNIIFIIIILLLFILIFLVHESSQ